jgi:S1-C subfamily serine protease
MTLRVVGLALGTAVAAPRLLAQTGSLAGAAASANERHETASAAAKRYTNADLQPCREEEVPAAQPIHLAPATPAAAVAREDIVRMVSPAVGTIQAGSASGSGFFVAPGVMLTNKHVVQAGSPLRIRFSDGTVSSAAIIRSARDADLALVQVEAPPPNQPTVVFGGAQDVQIGEDVLAIGTPLGLLHTTVTRGIVSALRTIGGVMYVQTDAAINPGNSGGPLIDMRGRVIGVTTMKMTAAESLGFAIAIDHARALLDGQAAMSAAPRGGCGPAADDAGRDASLDAAFKGAAKSDSEATRDRGVQQFEQAMRVLAHEADNIDVQWRRYVTSCTVKSPSRGSNGRDWFGIWSDATVGDDRSSPTCQHFLSDLKNVGSAIGQAVKQADERARRAGVYPGTIREIRRKYAMDWPGWDY